MQSCRLDWTMIAIPRCPDPADQALPQRKVRLGCSLGVQEISAWFDQKGDHDACPLLTFGVHLAESRTHCNLVSCPIERSCNISSFGAVIAILMAVHMSDNCFANATEVGSISQGCKCAARDTLLSTILQPVQPPRTASLPR